MIAVRPFDASDLLALDLQPMQARDPLAQAHGQRAAAAELGPSFTATGASGRILLCAGMIETHPGYATAWALLADGLGADHLALTRATARVIAATRYTRVDMIVRTDFLAAHRWALALGFTREGTLRRWGADGSDADIYARVRSS